MLTQMPEIPVWMLPFMGTYVLDTITCSITDGMDGYHNSDKNYHSPPINEKLNPISHAAILNPISALNID